MKKSVVPFVSVVAFAVIASNSVHAAGVNQDDLALVALNKIAVQHVIYSAFTPSPAIGRARVTQAHHKNDNVIGKSQVKAIIAQELNHSLKITKSDLLGSEPLKLIGSDPIYSNATAMLTD
ncbi:hypothetical protein N8985_01130 [Glaciecola sp.]|nr:hypothetical protein [Glaciecola sp.]